jgi:glycosyltransferase involved in cell wall biosynthesis
VSDVRHFVSWQPLLTDHQAFTLRALPRPPDETIIAYVGRTADAVRDAQGWTRSAEAEIAEEMIPRRGWLRFIRSRLAQHAASVHVFCSPFGDRRVFVALLLALFSGRKTYLVSEPYSTTSAGYFGEDRPVANWLRLKLRPLVYRLYGRLMRERIRGVFAISPLAVAQYAAAGIARQRIFPFGYFVPAPAPSDSPASPGHDEPGRLRLVFVGSLIARKGLADLAQAVTSLRRKGRAVEVDVYGPGDGDSPLFRDDGVAYRGQIPFGQASTVMAGYDALVAPSLFDGWGVVVNEALQAGIPVLCSYETGAGAMVAASGSGSLFDAGRPGTLADRLCEWMDEPAKLAAARKAAQALGPRLTPETAGRYMRDVIEHVEGAGPRPACPWYADGAQGVGQE